MLIITHRTFESIIIETSDGTIEVVICKINGRQARVGIEAPDSIHIWHGEIAQESAA